MFAIESFLNVLHDCFATVSVLLNAGFAFYSVSPLVTDAGDVQKNGPRCFINSLYWVVLGLPVHSTPDRLVCFVTNFFWVAEHVKEFIRIDLLLLTDITSLTRWFEKIRNELIEGSLLKES